jgi:diguanylate cyclase
MRLAPLHAQPGARRFGARGEHCPLARLMWGLLWLTLALLWLTLAPVAHAQTTPPVTLSDSHKHIDLWPSVTVLSDPTQRLSWQEAAASTAYTRPSGPYANLGRSAHTFWLRVPLQMPPTGSDGHWWLSIDYPLLDVAELHLVTGGQQVQQALMGDMQLIADRPTPSSMLAVPLRLQAGQRYELLLRVRSETGSTLLVPLSLRKPSEMLRHEGQVQLVQGLALGLGLCVFFFTLVRLLATRQVLYLWFTLATLASVLFFTAYTGVAAQHVWPHSLWLTVNAPPLMTLLILSLGSLFVDRSLDMPQHGPKASLGMRAVAAVAGLSALAMVLGLINYPQAGQVAAVIGLLPMMLALPVAYRRARSGDRASQWTLAGWLVYAVGVFSFTLLNIGKLDATPFNIGLYQLCSCLETLAWLMVLGVRAKEFQQAAEHAKREHARVLQISQTDPLTGLLNRRGLQLGLPMLVQQANPSSLTAIYLIDLDGFKPINDTHGHDAGDELLIKMGERLKAAVRTGDLVARLGGDEFVVVASQLRGEAEAEQVGHKLLACSQSDFKLAHATCHVGMTVGYAVAPLDGSDADALVRRADNAMYGGKQAGKNRVRRATEMPTEA